LKVLAVENQFTSFPNSVFLVQGGDNLGGLLSAYLTNIITGKVVLPIPEKLEKKSARSEG
jgi:hypothetical protein